MNTLNTTKKRAPRRKIADPSIMKEAPFYDGAMSMEDKINVTGDDNMWRCVMAAHHHLKLYVWKSYSNTVEMVDVHGFPRLKIRCSSGDKGVEILDTYSSIDAAGYTWTRVMLTKNIARAVSLIVNGKRDRYGQFDSIVPEATSEPKKVWELFNNMANSISRGFELSPKYINMSSVQTTWAARLMAGEVAITDVPTNVYNDIRTLHAKYAKEVNDTTEVLTQLREAMCRDKWMIASFGDGSLSIGKYNLSAGYKLIEDYVAGRMDSWFDQMKLSSATYTCAMPLRRYYNINAVPENIRAEIIPQIIPFMIRKGVPQHEWNSAMFGREMYDEGAKFYPEIDVITYRRSSHNTGWHLVNA